MKKYIHTFSVVALIFIFGSCAEKNDPVVEESLVEVATGDNGEIGVTIQSTTELFVGFNSLSINVTNLTDNSSINDATITIIPMMHMMTMSHTCPVDNKTTTLNEKGKYNFDVVFVMPSGDMGYWEITFKVEYGGKIQEVVVPVNVIQPEETKLISFVSEQDQTTKYFVALIDPKSPQVGENDLEVSVYKKASMMDWPAVEGLSFELEPWMTSMDHGSPNNIAPVEIGNGHYKGKVNFTMTGDWEIRLTMKEGNNLVGSPVFTTVFQ
ncbi:MAG: FixH family protein [Cyclobacteriaceae bacterium]|nr:FixH family protein [Cyclobacteriaceae bacterium]